MPQNGQVRSESGKKIVYPPEATTKKLAAQRELGPVVLHGKRWANKRFTSKIKLMRLNSERCDNCRRAQGVLEEGCAPNYAPFAVQPGIVIIPLFESIWTRNFFARHFPTLSVNSLWARRLNCFVKYSRRIMFRRMQRLLVLEVLKLHNCQLQFQSGQQNKHDRSCNMECHCYYYFIPLSDSIVWFCWKRNRKGYLFVLHRTLLPNFDSFDNFALQTLPVIGMYFVE